VLLVVLGEDRNVVFILVAAALLEKYVEDYPNVGCNLLFVLVVG